MNCPLYRGRFTCMFSVCTRIVSVVWRCPLFRGFHNKDLSLKNRDLAVCCMKVSVVKSVR